MGNDIYIVGTGGFAREVLFLLDDLGRFGDVKAFLEPASIWEERFKESEIMEKKVLPMSDYRPSKGQVIIGVADAKIRKLSTEQLPVGTDYLTVVHPSACVSRWCKIGEGSVITAGCIVTTQVDLGVHCHLNLGTTIGHDTKVKSFFTTAPAVNISGVCNIHESVYFGTGAATRQGINICSDVTIGMGAMVVKDITEAGTYVGIPAKRIVPK